MSKNVVLNNLNKDRKAREQGLKLNVAGETVNKLVNFKESAGLKLKWSQVVDRYQNDFDYSAEQDAKLIEEIREFGLQHEPTVVKINKYLSLNDVPEKARTYYEEARKNGYEYFIISGHRRSRAVESLCWGKQIGLDKTEFQNWYKKEFGELSIDAAEIENKWAVIEVKEFEPKSVEEEEKFTQVENFSNRVIKTFTWVYNAYKLMSEKEKVTAEDVTKFVNEKYGVELSSGSIGNYLTVIRTFEDQRYIESIFNGILSVNQAKKLVSPYKKYLAKNEEKRNEFINRIRIDNDSIDKMIEDFSGKKKKTKKVDKEKLTKKTMIQLCNKVKENEISIDEMIDIINEKY